MADHAGDSTAISISPLIKMKNFGPHYHLIQFMLREKFSRFLSYSGASSAIKKTLISSLAVAFSTVKAPKAALKTYEKQYDLAVIGGGSGGLATAFEANKHGLNVIVIDFVEESSHKSKWGLGGTCVNVGCIPKKLMHQAAKAREEITNSGEYGWDLPEEINERSRHEELSKRFNWVKLKNKVQGYIKSINFGYIANINREEGLDYLNCLATFKDKDTLVCSKDTKIIYEYIKTGHLPQNNHQNPLYYEIKASNFLIATGTRPSYLQLDGAHHAITSDDIFMKKTPPGKTLIVGGGYVAVEIAGFLNGMGYHVSLMTRGDYLRSFDRDMVAFILKDLQQRHVNIVQTSLPYKIEKLENGRLSVIVKNQKTSEVRPAEEFDTVLFAVGRTATTDTLNLQKIGVQTSKSKKIKTREEEVERTSVDNIYAIGDVVEGLPQLTSTATKMGWHLGRRIVQRLGKGKFKPHQLSVSLENYPTTIFTPLEYSCSGLSEEEAIKKFGREDVNVYHVLYTPLEENILEKYNEQGDSLKTNSYAKAVVQKSTDRVLGLHYAGPHAGEVMQGFAVALRIGLTKQQLDATIGIHPTSAEELTNMDVTKQSGLPFEKTSC